MGTSVQQGELLGNKATDGPVKELQTIDDDGASIFERWAKDPAVDVDKFERFMAMWERERARRAEVAFDNAMASAQEEMEPVRKNARNTQTNSRYATFEALDEAVRPIYTKHGFGLSFDTGDAPHAEEVRMLCYVSQRGGHRRTYKLDLPADGKGAKGGDVMTRTHATVSATSYGQRVLLRMIFNIAIGDDDDGNRAGGRTQRPEPKAPEGYDAWFSNLEGLADGGQKAWDVGWANSPEPLRKHLADTAPTLLAALKVRARKAGR